jgi:hypothetical protein
MKYALVLPAVFAGLASWVGLIYAFRYSRIAALETLTFWISHLAFTGWLLAIVLIVVWWKILVVAIAHWFGPTSGGSV